MTTEVEEEGSAAAANSLEESLIPELIHDGESNRIYRARLPVSSFDDATVQALMPGADDCKNKTNNDNVSSPPMINVAVKICQPDGYADVFRLNNEFNILRLGAMVSCPSTRMVLKREESFDGPDGAKINGTALYCEWVDGVTLADWLKNTRVKADHQDDGGSISLSDDDERKNPRILHQWILAKLTRRVLFYSTRSV